MPTSVLLVLLLHVNGPGHEECRSHGNIPRVRVFGRDVPVAVGGGPIARCEITWPNDNSDRFQ
jgi:hypothetical protein